MFAASASAAQLAALPRRRGPARKRRSAANGLGTRPPRWLAVSIMRLQGHRCSLGRRSADAATIIRPAACRGIRGSIGSRASALMLVESRAVRSVRRCPRGPAPRPCRCTVSSPLGVPGVCAGRSGLGSRGHVRSSSRLTSRRHDSTSNGKAIRRHARASPVGPAAPATPSTSTAVTSGALLVDRLLDRLLQRRGRRRAAVAAALAAAAGRRRRSRRAVRRCRRASAGRPHLVQRLRGRASPGPAGAARAAGAGPPPVVIARRRRGSTAPGLARLGQVLQDALQAGAVQVRTACTISRRAARAAGSASARPPAAARRVGAVRLEVVRSRAWSSWAPVDVRHLRASGERGLLLTCDSREPDARASSRLNELTPARRTSARAAPRAPCRRPGTCGRRRAGTDRSCAPPA